MTRFGTCSAITVGLLLSLAPNAEAVEPFLVSDGVINSTQLRGIASDLRLFAAQQGEAGLEEALSDAIGATRTSFTGTRHRGNKVFLLPRDEQWSASPSESHTSFLMYGTLDVHAHYWRGLGPKVEAGTPAPDSWSAGRSAQPDTRDPRHLGARIIVEHLGANVERGAGAKDLLEAWLAPGETERELVFHREYKRAGKSPVVCRPRTIQLPRACTAALLRREGISEALRHLPRPVR